MISFPVAPAEFWNLLPIMALTFDAPPVVSWSRAANGQAWSVDIGDALFTGTVTLGKMTESERAGIEPVIDVLRHGGRTFYASDRRKCGPAADPFGRVLAGAAPTILALPSQREIALTGLPARYVLKRGDYLAFDRPDGARALHLVVEALVVADAAGVTAAFEVTPPIPPGAATGVAVTLVAPTCKAMFIPASVIKATSHHTIASDATFQFVQSLS